MPVINVNQINKMVGTALESGGVRGRINATLTHINSNQIKNVNAAAASHLRDTSKFFADAERKLKGARGAILDAVHAGGPGIKHVGEGLVEVPAELLAAHQPQFASGLRDLDKAYEKAATYHQSHAGHIGAKDARLTAGFTGDLIKTERARAVGSIEGLGLHLPPGAASGAEAVQAVESATPWMDGIAASKPELGHTPKPSRGG